MITETSVRNVSTIGNAVEASYTIEDSAKIFSILRSNIYSDKILAVIREYSTNGWDGHILAGTPDRKLLITLPTTLSPIFKVRDFGVGLSEESVMHIYTSYGTSTKDSSNDFNGTFGLGSKSAFAYGNTFGITSYFNGVKTLYTAYLDETNIGKIRKEYSEPTSEENGVEIEIAVKTADIRQFNETASMFYRHFTPSPDFVGGDGTVVSAIEDFHNLPVMFSGDIFTITAQPQPYWKRQPSVVRMGNVAYPINLDALAWIDDRKDILNKGHVIIDIPIGSVSITASREALEYDKRTKDFVIGRICHIHNEILRQTQEQVDSLPTFWEAAVKLNSLRDLDSSISNKINFNKWSNIRYTKGTGYYSTGVMLDDKFVRDEICQKHGVAMKSFTYFSSPRLSGYRVSQIVPDNNTLFVINRPGKVKKEETMWRVRGAYNAHKGNTDNRLQIILVEFESADTSDALLKGIFAGTRNVFLENCDILKYQSNRSSVRRATVNTDLSKTKIFTFNRGNDKTTKSNNWDAVSNDEIANGSGVFVRINAYEIAGDTCMGSMEQVNRVLNTLEAMNITTVPVYGIRDSVNKIGAGWVSFQDWVTSVVNKHIDTMGLADNLAEYIEVTNNLHIGNRSFAPSKGGWDLGSYLLNDEFPACDLKRFAIRVCENNQKFGILPKIAQLRVWFVGIKVGNTDIQQELASIIAKYPGLSLILHNNCNGSDEFQKEELIRYVQSFNKTDEQNYFRIVM
jgi:hypothetical protein